MFCRDPKSENSTAWIDERLHAFKRRIRQMVSIDRI